MRLYLDDDSAAALLVRLLRQAGHDVQIPADAGLSGEDDAVHLTYAIKDDRKLLTGNHRDFLNLHNLVMQAQGHHPGILVVRRDNDPKRDLAPSGIVRAVRSLLAVNVDANLACEHSFRLAKAMNISLKVTFEWRDKVDAAHPGQTGIIEWNPNDR